MRLPLFAVAAAVLNAAPAHADCEDRIAEMQPTIARVTDMRLRALLDVDMQRAQRDMWEFDEVECAVNLEHATKLLKLGL